MTSLTVTTDNVDNLSITNNADLETIDLSAMTSIGATGTALSINGNKLEASLADDENVPLSTSGMASAKVYLDAVAADADSKANVVFDSVESVEGSDGVKTGTDVLDYAVLVLTPKLLLLCTRCTKTQKSLGCWSRWCYNIWFERTRCKHILVNGSEVAQDKLTLDANEVLAYAVIKRAAALTRATAYDLTLDAFSGYKPTGQIRITSATATSEYTFNGDKNSGVATARAADFINLTIDGLTVSTTVSTDATSALHWVKVTIYCKTC